MNPLLKEREFGFSCLAGDVSMRTECVSELFQADCRRVAFIRTTITPSVIIQCRV